MTKRGIHLGLCRREAFLAPAKEAETGFLMHPAAATWLVVSVATRKACLQAADPKARNVALAVLEQANVRGNLETTA